jgi:hypothetical protein
MKKYIIKENTNYGKRFRSASYIDIAEVEAKNKEEALEKLCSPQEQPGVKVICPGGLTGRDFNAFKAFVK